jgi:hypothetical protein
MQEQAERQRQEHSMEYVKLTAEAKHAVKCNAASVGTLIKLMNSHDAQVLDKHSRDIRKLAAEELMRRGIELK